MDMEWVISLVAVIVSLVTIVISYLTNRENLKHASKGMVSAHRIEFNIEVWKDIIDLSEKLLNVTNRDRYEQFVNIAVAGKTNDVKDEVVLNDINNNCETIGSLVFNLCAKIKVLDRPNKELRDRIRNYAKDIVSAYKDLQKFYLDKYATRADYEKIAARAEEFSVRGDNFSHHMQNYISELQNILFETENKIKNNLNKGDK